MRLELIVDSVYELLKGSSKQNHIPLSILGDKSVLEVIAKTTRIEEVQKVFWYTKDKEFQTFLTYNPSLSEDIQLLMIESSEELSLSLRQHGKPTKDVLIVLHHKFPPLKTLTEHQLIEPALVQHML